MNLTSNKLTFLALFLLASFQIVSSQENGYLGINGGYSLITNFTRISLNPIADDCGIFKNGSRNGYFGEIKYVYPLAENLFELDLRANYEYRPIGLQQTTSNYEVFNVNRNAYTFLEREHRFDATLQYISGVIGFLIQPIPDFPFKVRVGFEVGDPLISAKYENTETISEPEGYLYPDGKSKRVIASGDLSTQTSFGAIGGASYDVRLDKRLVLVPEVSFRYGLNSVSDKLEWMSNIVRIGVGIQFQNEKEKPIEEPKPTPEPTPEPVVVTNTVPPQLPNNILSGIEVKNIDLVETVVTQTYPLLPYIFFDSTSSELKPEYKRDVNRAIFNEKDLPKTTLDIYTRMLDIIGSRLYKSPNSKIEILGVTDGNEFESQSQRIDLASKRANTVSQYLQKNWGLNSNQIIVKSKDVPSKATSLNYQEGYEENRRVELYSNNPEILKPVYHSKFLEYQASNEQLTVKFNVNDEKRPANAELILYADNEPIFFDNIVGTLPPSYSINLTQEYMTKLASKKGKNFYAVLKVQGMNSEAEQHSAQFEINMTKNQFELGRLNLIVFDFDKSEITTQNQEMLKDFVGLTIAPNSTTKITGSTDKLGEEQHNKELSTKRALAVQDFILNLKPEFKFTEVKGVGSNKSHLDNITPEGRFYCRTVLIEVQTPINKK
jgi:outer membrane protein OmpA-like peptidoglycan-associated protein